MKVAFAVLLALACFMVVGIAEKSSPEVTASIEQEAHDKKITFTFPLEYTATVTQCDQKRECRTRFYNPRQK